MDPIEKDLLLRDVASYGYQLLRPDTANPEKVLQRMLMSDDARVLEGFPVVLSNVLVSKDHLELSELEKSLPSNLQRRFRTLAAVTYLFMFWIPESDDAKRTLLQYLNKREPSIIENVQDNLRNRGKISVGSGMTLDAQRLEKTYKNYVVEQFKQSQASFSKQLEDKRQEVFQEAMSELFTDKQRELVLKMLNKETLSKTEREYYSRVIKRRLKALRNPDLQSVAATLLGY